MTKATLKEKYGPWAIVAGASEGLGAAFAAEVAAAGLNLVLLARRADALEDLAKTLRAAHGVEVVTAAVDLGAPDMLARVKAAVAGREIGLLVYNAAHSVIGTFLDVSLESKLTMLDVNCRGPLLLSDEYGRAMAARKRGGILLMSSMAGYQGVAMVSVYAATKAFNTVLGEALWDELRRHGVDVVPFIAGATTTPAFLRTEPTVGKGPMAPPLMAPDVVAREALASLGKGPRAVAGLANRVALFFMDRFFSRQRRVMIIGSATRKMYAKRPAT